MAKYDREEIKRYLQGKSRNRYAEITETQIDNEITLRKTERIEYIFLFILNIALFVGFIGFGIAAIVTIFMSKWNFMIGFGVLSFICLWIFRRIPYPMTRMEKAVADLKAGLRAYR